MFGFDRRQLARIVAALGLLAAAAGAWAQQADPPGRVGRLADVQGKVWLYDQEEGQWVEALRNRELTSGDRLSTERGARAEVRIGSTELRIAADTELEFDRIDDERMVIQLDNGSLALRVRSREIAREIEVRSAEVRILPERTGHYRIDREDDTTYAAAWRGSLHVDTGDQQVQVAAGRRAEFFRDGRLGGTAVSWSAPVNDAFSDWVARDERSDDHAGSQRYVSPEMTGAEDLDRYGRWESHPEYGMVWYPLQVSVGWTPYRYGRWNWSVTWGWTWVDDAPWGFAPFHYGRWVHWGGRWCWSPGAYVARPVYAPALVAWVGGSGVNFSISVGGHSGPAVGWVPLAPRDVYLPPYRYAPRYYERVNQPHRNYHPPQVPTGPIMYGNRGVPDAVTVVPADVLRRRQPVANVAIRDREVQRVIERERFRSEVPVPARVAPPRVVPVPGGAEPMRRVPPAPGRDAAPPRVIDLRRERPSPMSPSTAPVAPSIQPTAPAQSQRPVPIERPARPERPDQVQRVERPERAERPEGTPRPERAERPIRSERPERPAQAERPAVVPVPKAQPQPQPQVVPAPAPAAQMPAPPRVAPPPKPEREPRAEPRDDNRGRDDRGPRTPDSRQNQRDRQGVQ